MSTYLITRPTFGPLVHRQAPRRTVSVIPALTAPAVDVTRDGEDGLITVEALGLDPAADLAVAVTGDRLTVTGDRLTVTGVRRSTTGGVQREARFSRTLVLPDGMGQDAVSADYSAGVLRVRVAGMFPTPARPQTHTVAITSDVAVEVAALAEEHAEVDRTSGSNEQQSEAPAAA